MPPASLLAPPPPASLLRLQIPPQNLLPLDPPSVPRRWHHSWMERERLLERQHDGLEALLATQIRMHRIELQESGSSGCLRLLRKLTLHLRLEERWLGECSCLCPGHLAAHRAAALAAAEGFERAGSDPVTRLGWLLELRAWFEQHRSGPDARAYARARSLSQP